MSDSLLLVDKPVGFSSFQIVRILQRRYKKVGHAGTLDPFASGLLILLINKATKRFNSVQKWEKEYCGEILLGITTDSYDITGVETRPRRAVQGDIESSQLNEISEKFVGEIQQIPPSFSALKHQGKKLYQLSRKKLKVKIAARKVFVKSFNISEIDLPILRFRAVVGKGVYIRSLAHDFGEALGCGATLLSLRRIRIGEYNIADAKNIGALFSLSC